MEICHECGSNEEHFNLRKCVEHLIKRAEEAEAEVKKLLKDKDKLEKQLMKANGRLMLLNGEIVRVT